MIKTNFVLFFILILAFSFAGCGGGNNSNGDSNNGNKSGAYTITTIAGTGTSGYSGDSGPATKAKISVAADVAMDASGNLYIADEGNHRIRKVNTSGIITTFAGAGTSGYSGDGGAATGAKLYNPSSIALDASGNLYIADQSNHCIRKVNTSGIITTFAGTGTSGYSGDGGTATGAKLYNPLSIALDASGNLYIADQSNHCIRKVNTSGIITTIAGTGTEGYGGDGAAATGAQLNDPSGVEVDASGNIYIADAHNNRIRKVDTSGNISTIAGNGIASYGGDGGIATNAKLYRPYGVAVDDFGNIYIADNSNHRIRKVDTSSIITTLAGTGTQGYSGDGGAAAIAELNYPCGVAVDASGTVYIADTFNHCVRKLTKN